MLAFVSCKSLDEEKKKGKTTFIGQRKNIPKIIYFSILDLQSNVHLNTLEVWKMKEFETLQFSLFM